MMRLSLFFAAVSIGAAQTQSSLRRLVIPGNLAATGDFPAYGVANPWNNCGGTLVAPDMVVTAASCDDKFVIGTGNRFVLGSLNVNGAPPSSGSFNIVEKYPHFSFNEGTFENDIMLMRLSGQSTTTPAKFNTDTAIPAENDSGRVIGFGNVAGAAEHSSLYSTTVTVQRTSVCNEDTAYDGRVLGDMFCAGDGACSNGDEGGPLFSTTGDIIGIFSFSDACSSGIPGVYTKVANYRTWMEEVICANTQAAKPSYCTGLATASPTASPVTPGTCLGGVDCAIYAVLQGLVAALVVAGGVGLFLLL